MDRLDDDSRRIITSFLDAKSIIALQASSREWNSACRARDIWSRLVTIDFEISASRPPPAERGTSLRDRAAEASSRLLSSLRPQARLEAASTRLSVLAAALAEHPYSIYKRHAQSRKMKRAAALERARSRETEAETRGKKTRLRYCLDALEYPLGLGLYGAVVFATAVLLTLKLNGTAPGLPWFAVLAPLVLQGGTFVLSLLVGACTRFCDRLALPRHMCDGQSEASRHSTFAALGRFVSKSADEWRRGWRRACCRCAGWTWPIVFLLLLFVATPALVALKLQGGYLPDGMPWAAVLAPLWATFCWWMLLPCVSIRGRGCGACAMFILATLMIVIPLAIVAALVIARVDGVHYAPVAAILTPFWLIDAGVLIGVVFGLVMLFVVDDADDRVPICFMVCVALASLAPALVAEIWASIADARGDPFPVNGVLGPVAALCGLLLLANCVCAAALWKAGRHSDYEDAYRPRTCRQVCCRCCCRRCCSSADEGPVIVVIDAPGMGPDRPLLGGRR